MIKKTTKMDRFNMLKAILADVQAAGLENVKNEDIEDLQIFIDHEIALLQKKYEKSSRSKIQDENAVLMANMKVVMSDYEDPLTVGDLMKDERLSMYSMNKLSALLKKLIDSGEVVRTEIKRRAYFSLA